MTEFADVAIIVARTKMYQQRDRQNPFVAKTFSTEEILRMLPDVLESLGNWQENDCKVMRSALVGLAPRGTGRVPLSLLYEQPVFRDEAGRLTFRFAESQDNLRDIG